MSGFPVNYKPAHVVEVPANPLVPGSQPTLKLIYSNGVAGDVANGGGILGYSEEVSTKEFRVVLKTVTIPAVPPGPPIPDSDYARINTKIVTDMQLGWDGGARSLLIYSGDLFYSFKVNANPIGIVTGLSSPDRDTGVTYQEIQFAFHIQHGQYRIVESGQFLTNFAPYNQGDEFKITRVGSVVNYAVAGATVYTSLQPSIVDSVLVDASLYSANDEIIDAAVTPLAGNYCHGGLTAKPGSINDVTNISAKGGLTAKASELFGSSGTGGRAQGSMTSARPTAGGTVGQWQPETALGGLVAAAPSMGGLSVNDSVIAGGLTAKPADIAGSSGTVGRARGGLKSRKPGMAGTSGMMVYTSFPRLVGIQEVIRWDGSGETLAQASLREVPGRIGWAPEAASWHLRAFVETASGRSDDAEITPWHLKDGLASVRSSRWRLRGLAQAIHWGDAAGASIGPGSSIVYCCNLHFDDGPEVTTLRAGWADFLRIVRIGSKTFGLKADGFYQIGGDNFDGVPILAKATLHYNSFGWPYMQRCKYVYGGFSAAALISPIVADRDYGAFKTVRGKSDQWLAQLPWGIRDQFWSFSISNVDGQPLRVDWIEPRFEHIANRVA